MKRIRQKTRKNKGLLGRIINRIRGGKNDNQKFVEPAKYGGVLDEVEVISKAKGPSKSSFNPLESISRIVKNKISENVVPYGYQSPIGRVWDAIRGKGQEGNASGFGSDQMGKHEEDIRIATSFDEAETMRDFLTQFDAEHGIAGNRGEGYYDKYSDKESNLPHFVNKALASRERQQLFNAMLGQSGNEYKGELALFYIVILHLAIG